MVPDTGKTSSEFMQSDGYCDVVQPICCTQKVAIYETKSRFYLVGSNNSQSRFRVLKIDRTEPTEINIIDDKVEYNQVEIQDLLQRIDFGNRPKSTKGYVSAGLIHRGSAFGILGFIKFLEGYYIILISKRRRVALIGGHTIFKIDDTAIIPLANEHKISTNPDEARYLRIFQNVDLSSNFYFSYSYDLSRTLQYNLAPFYGLPVKYARDKENKSFVECEDVFSISSNIEENIEDSNEIDNEKFLMKSSQEPKKNSSANRKTLPSTKKQTKKYKTRVFRGTPEDKFVWNCYILEALRGNVHPDWLLNIIHGFVGQSNVCVFGKPVYVTLIARRSNRYAGTRFLKRGANDEGYVANDVETEQICHDASTIDLRSGNYTSYTQVRGSVPFFWSQDTIQGRITPKPQILVDRADPYFVTTAQHFNKLLMRFGSPLILLNLVKKKEKKPHEQILSNLLNVSVDYLNQFIPLEHQIRYIAWDMARVTKSKEVNVIESLAEIAERVMKETGFFHSGPMIYCNRLRQHPQFSGMKGFGYTDENPGLRQTGILRVNCVDCLDRTNTAQFMVGKCALGFQMYALGMTDSPILEFDSDAVRILEELFEAHGDTCSLQYGGSQMVHRIRTYRKIAPWTSYSRDIMQTVSRYYSNAFTDTDKQQAINIFLGIFKPSSKCPHIWDIPTDYYLHHKDTMIRSAQSAIRPSYTNWCSPSALKVLPLSVEEYAKQYLIEQKILKMNSSSDMCDESDATDLFAEFYRPSELTEFDSLYSKIMPTSTKDFMPSTTADASPFVVRVRGSGGQDLTIPPRKVVGGSPSSPEESSDDDDEDSEDERKLLSPLKQKVSPGENGVPGTYGMATQWDCSSDSGIDITEPAEQDLQMYARYVEQSKLSQPIKHMKRTQTTSIILPTLSEFSSDSSFSVAPPTVDTESSRIYAEYCKIGVYGPSQPSESDLLIYDDYLSQNYM